MTISEHCIDRYLERIAPAHIKQRRHSASVRDAVHLEIAMALLLGPLCQLSMKDGSQLLGLKNRARFLFMVKLSVSGDVVETCGPIWFWHEARKYWKTQGFDPKKLSKGKKKPGAGFAARIAAQEAENAACSA